MHVPPLRERQSWVVEVPLKGTEKGLPLARFLNAMLLREGEVRAWGRLAASCGKFVGGVECTGQPF